jgi:hypothetical protein
MEPKKQVIKILIAAHKKAELPQNALFLPVEGGAALHAQHPGYQRDDERENISEKNPFYSELSVIYWGWKNVEADYCGLMHYRRYLSFSDKRYPVSRDGRKMILLPAVSQSIYAEYGLTDEEKMRQIIEANDIIVAESQNVGQIMTPHHTRRHTVHGHYEDHENVITKMSDINLTLEIAKKKFPKVAKSIDDYMAQKWYLGYNMFILKKPLYDDLCAFMFDTLFEVEKQINIQNYGQQMARVYGYLAEILSSIYIYHLRKTQPDLKVAEKQMIFIKNADSNDALNPIEDAVPIVFNLTSSKAVRRHPVLFLPSFKTFLEQVSPQKKYDVLIAYHDRWLSDFFKAEIQRMAAEHDAVTLRFVNFENELYKLGISRNGDLEIRFLAAWIFPKYQSILMFEWSCLFFEDPSTVFSIGIDENKWIGASQDLFIEGQLNDYIPQKRKLFERVGIKRENLHNGDVMYLNLEKQRDKSSVSKATEGATKISGERHLTLAEKTTCFFGDKIDSIPQKWNYVLETDEGMGYMLSLAPLRLYQDFQKVKRYHEGIGHFEEYAINRFSETQFSSYYWGVAKKIPTYPLLLRYAFKTRKSGPELRDKLLQIAPEESAFRRFTEILLPRDSKRRTFIRRIFRI